MDSSTCKRIKELYELIGPNLMTLNQIATVTGTSKSTVGRYVIENYPEEFRKKRNELCYHYANQKELHPNYKGGRTMEGGYITVEKPAWYTGRKNSKYVREHNVLVCKAIGITEIPKGFCVHHINGNKVDNSLGNLQFMSLSAHKKLHLELKRRGRTYGCK
jgi:hypothetical protein